jgi:predicted RNase H-like nuclease (RuvC/YqgF family)
MSNIPSFSDVCGTVVESLAETIQNRERIIIQLREENERLQRVAADAVRKATVWQNEVEACEGDEKKIRDLQRTVSELTTQRDEARRLYCVFAANVEQKVDAQHIASQWGWDCYPKSDSDPVTGVQYGDLN